MKSVLNTLLLMFFPVLSFAFLSNEAGAQPVYAPFGPQTNVPIQTVTGGGWTECYRDTYNIQINPGTVLSQCTGNLLILSCLPTGSDTLTLLAAGERTDVTFDTGDNEDVTHIANGVGWYFNNTGLQSWGFVKAGDSVDKDNCDVDTSGANDERLCWHLNVGGYRCGETMELNSSSSFERIVYTANGTLPGPSNPIPTLSEWSLIIMAGALGIIGLIISARRRKAAA
ncbi:MAG TPA: IPTL-CTERM sorting domain-containing protein [Thermodesulfobacteriota bacterium]|nr:IPTL-CTERM sorting domain-containing protein [Thermodesulfobacteriota bacterium]